MSKLNWRFDKACAVWTAESERGGQYRLRQEDARYWTLFQSRPGQPGLEYESVGKRGGMRNATLLEIAGLAEQPRSLRDHLLGAVCSRAAYHVYLGQWSRVAAVLEGRESLAWVTAYRAVLSAASDRRLSADVQSLARETLAEPALLGVLADACSDAGLDALERAVRLCGAFASSALAAA